MIDVALFGEDQAHEVIVRTITSRVAELEEVETQLVAYSCRGGAARVATELRHFLRDVQREVVRRPGVLIVARDSNCKGFQAQRRELQSVVADFDTAFAIPEPHIERWLLIDGEAFKRVLGRGCAAPDKKCGRARYKQVLRQAIRGAGREPIFGGLEFAAEIAQVIDLDRCEAADKSFGSFVADLRGALRRHEHGGRS